MCGPACWKTGLVNSSEQVREGFGRGIATLLKTVLARAVEPSPLASSPGCAPLRRARFPAPLRAAFLPSARSAHAAPTRAHVWVGPLPMS